MSLVPTGLEPLYGNRATFGLGVCLTLRPAALPGSDPHAGHRMP